MLFSGYLRVPDAEARAGHWLKFGQDMLWATGPLSYACALAFCLFLLACAQLAKRLDIAFITGLGMIAPAIGLVAVFFLWTGNHAQGSATQQALTLLGIGGVLALLGGVEAAAFAWAMGLPRFRHTAPSTSPSGDYRGRGV